MDVAILRFITAFSLIFHISIVVANESQPQKTPANKKTKHCSCGNIPSRFGMASMAAKKHPGMVQIPAGFFMMGGDNNQARPDELPKHPVKIHSFLLDTTQVTNTEFQKFVETTKYVTT